MGDSGDRDAGWFEQLPQVARSGLSFDVSTEGKNDFLHSFLLNPRKKTTNGEILRSNMIERRNLASEAMICAAKNTGALEGNHIGRLLDHAKQFAIAVGVFAQRANVILGKKSAPAAWADRRHGVPHCGRELFHCIPVPGQHPQGEALRGAGTDSRKFPQGLNQSVQRLWIIDAFHALVRRTVATLLSTIGVRGATRWGAGDPSRSIIWHGFCILREDHSCLPV